jgi:hypothetical protein
MNRILAAVSRVEEALKGKTVDSTKFDMSIREYVLLQERKSLAHANGAITFEEAQTIYGYLGESVNTFNNQPVAVKMVMTKVLAEMIGVRR